jgi:glycine cleavage system H protein
MTGEVTELQRTPLHELHLALGAKMVAFAGYAMPLQYRDGIIKEHRHTRGRAGLFDVSHMGQVRLHGAAAAEAMESLVPVDVVGLAANHQRYALFTSPTGGILDDLMITNAGDHLFLVVNAACKDADFAHLHDGLDGRCEVEELPGRALLALQGPEAGAVMARLAPATRDLVFMTAAEVAVDGIACFVTRSGYTGEDGFEISVPADRAADLARRLLAQDGVRPAGLGALPLRQRSRRRHDPGRGRAGLGAVQGAPRRGRAARRLSRRRGDPAPAGRGRPAPAGRPAARGPGAGARGRRADRRGGARGRQGDQRAVRPHGRGPRRHGLRRDRPDPAALRPKPLPSRLNARGMTMSEIKYSEDHEWILIEGETGTVGVTDYAQEQLGDVVFVELPEVGKTLAKGDEVAVVESVKAASELYAPVSGEVTEANDALAEDPAQVNSDPLGAGWFFKLRITAPAELDGLMDEAAYKAYVEGLG